MRNPELVSIYIKSSANFLITVFCVQFYWLLVQAHNIKGGKLTKLVVKIVEISSITLPLFFYVDILRNPCPPIHLSGYWMVQTQCAGQIGTGLRATWSFSEILTKAIVFSVSYSNWTFLMSGSYFDMTLSFLIKSHCMRNYILQAGHQIIEGQSGKCKLNWHTCLMYREIEVMSTEYRRLYSRYMTVLCLLLMCI